MGESNDFDVNGSDGADKAFKFFLPNDVDLDITTCFPSTDYDTKIEVFKLDGTTTGLYNDDDSQSCGANRYSSAIYGGHLAAGTYYLVVDGYSGDEGDFIVDVKQTVVMKSANISAQGSNCDVLSDTDDLGKYKKEEMDTKFLKSISIYPNPANETVNIGGGNGLKFSYELFDASGRMVKSNTIVNSNFRIDVSTISQGVYFLNLINNEEVRTEKVIIKH